MNRLVPVEAPAAEAEPQSPSASSPSSSSFPSLPAIRASAARARAARDGRISPAEQAMLRDFDAQRRLALLRIIMPSILALVVLAIPGAVLSEMDNQSMQINIQISYALATFTIGVWATFARRVNLASTMLFMGVTGVVVFLIVSDGPMTGALDLTAMSDFALLALPIAIAGIFGGPRQVTLVTAGAVLLALGIIQLTPHGPGLAAVLARADGMRVFTIPLSALGALGVLMGAANRGFRRTQRELGDIRVAYAREKELDRLKDQFISSVNHELRTPIMALQGYLELARELGRRAEFVRQEQMLRRGTEAVEHLAGLVRSVLNVRRIEADAAAIAPVAFALQPTLLGATDLLSPGEAGEEPRELHLRIPAGLRVFADEQKVRQVALNLLSNATKYSPTGSPIEITARVVEGDPAAHGGRRARAKAMVEVAVRDHGLGIPPDQAVLLFQRFVRLERDIASPVTGTGLGLAICRAYIEAMGGRIWAESSGVPGEGSTFTFTLPLAAPAGEA